MLCSWKASDMILLLQPRNGLDRYSNQSRASSQRRLVQRKNHLIWKWQRFLLTVPCSIFLELPVSACGRTLQESSGTFSSPALEHGDGVSSKSVESNHVEYRPKPELCQWRIAATHGEKIVLNVTLLDILDTHDCYTDYLMVRDGHWHKSKLLGM